MKFQPKRIAKLASRLLHSLAAGYVAWMIGWLIFLFVFFASGMNRPDREVPPWFDWGGMFICIALIPVGFGLEWRRLSRLDRAQPSSDSTKSGDDDQANEESVKQVDPLREGYQVPKNESRS